MNRVRKIIHADECHKRGVRGGGITAAILDSGICEHPDYRDRVICFQDFVGRKDVLYDDASHGSHVTGILGGSGAMSMGKYRGIAPECDLVHLKILDHSGSGKIEHAAAAMEWILKNHRIYNIRVLNFSAGALPEREADARLLEDWVEKVWDAGITVVVAAGNGGPARGSITSPGTSRKVITAGFCETSVWEKYRVRRFYSGRGPTEECICKPEITAPGDRIVSCSNLKIPGQYYSIKSGSSMAAPVIAGAACLLLSEKPWLSNVEVKMKLKDAAEDLGLSRSHQGWGRLNLIKLLE